MRIFISFDRLKRDKQGWQVWKLAVSDRNNDFFCTNWPKEVSLTHSKTVSDVHIEYSLLCEIFRKIFCEVFHTQNISQNTVSRTRTFMIKCFKLFVKETLTLIKLSVIVLLNTLFCCRQDSWKPGNVIFSNLLVYYSEFMFRSFLICSETLEKSFFRQF